MKKLIAILLIVGSTLTSSAQMVKSRTLMKKEIPITWFIRAGLTIDNLANVGIDYKEYDYSVSPKAGFDVDFGFNRPIGQSGAYWGMDLGIQNRGGKLSYDIDYYDYETDREYPYLVKESINTWTVKYSPIMFGYKYNLSDNIKIDGHFSGFISYDISANYKTNRPYETGYYGDYIDAGIQIGAGVWFNKFNVDLSYQRGFCEIHQCGGSVQSSIFMIRLGCAFK